MWYTLIATGIRKELFTRENKEMNMRAISISLQISGIISTFNINYSRKLQIKFLGNHHDILSQAVLTDKIFHFYFKLVIVTHMFLLFSRKLNNSKTIL